MPDHVHQRLDQVPDLAALSRAHPDRFPYLLESAAGGPLGSRSLLLFAGDQALVLQRGVGVAGPGSGERFFQRLEQWFSRERIAAPDAGEALFPGGWFIYLGYEIAAEIEPTLELPANDTGLPDAIAHRCPGAVIIEHGVSGAAERAAVVAESPEIMRCIIDLLSTPAAERADSRGDDQDPPALEKLEEEEPARFISSVDRIHQYLRSGDVFQVNISRPWTGQFRDAADPYRLYRALRRANPAPFAGLMRWDGHFLLSSSPERLVQLRGRSVQTRPIAGTRPRSSDRDRDRALSEELISNLKERAEHIMLIDLERNDLGRVCRPGSVEVSELMVVETYAHVHHIVSNVRGVLRDDAGPVDAMKAVFPGGTITGCPKVRCMEIIAELEGRGRGFYTGSMGYLGRNGNLDLNILIRSMLLSGRRFRFSTGAGIVADSEPQRELEETGDKARGMLLALQPQVGEN
jgi:anthranilate synthase component 1